MIRPSPTHLHRFTPLPIHALALIRRDDRFEHRAIICVDVFQFFEIAPDMECEARGDGGAESGRFVHGGTVDGDLDDVCLGLDGVRLDILEFRIGGLNVIAYLHADVRHTHATVDGELLEFVS